MKSIEPNRERFRQVLGLVDKREPPDLRVEGWIGLKGKTDLEKFPGAIRVRHYLAGDAICRQGEAGWTAFYILTAADVENVIEAKPAAKPAGPVYRRSIADLVLLPEDADADVSATIYLSIPRKSASPNRGWLGRVNRRLFGGSESARNLPPGGAAPAHVESARVA